MIPLLVVLGAMVGAPLRYLTDRTVQARHDSVFPWGTLTVNILGSFLLGMLSAGLRQHGVSAPVMALFGTGFCGALTTYSTFSYDTLRLIEGGSRFFALVNVVANILAGLGAVFCGAAIGQTLFS